MGSFRHDAFLYAGEDEFLAGALPFVRAALAADEPVLVAVERAKIDLLQSELAGDAEYVRFADMGEIGGNPARIIPAWRQFVDRRTPPGQRIWGIGEPIGPDRGPAELVECQRHESLLNLAFADAAEFTLLCPYDTSLLHEDVVAEAHRSHPGIVQCGCRRPSTTYTGLDAVAAPFADPLPEPYGPVRELPFAGDDLAALRGVVAGDARSAGLGRERGEDIVLAVNEVASNSVRHGGGRGTLRLWREDGAFVCEVRDRGRLDDPLAGRTRPARDEIGGYGLWLANQVCDLVQLRSFADGSAVRLHMRLR